MMAGICFKILQGYRWNVMALIDTSWSWEMGPWEITVLFSLLWIVFENLFNIKKKKEFLLFHPIAWKVHMISEKSYKKVYVP